MMLRIRPLIEFSSSSTKLSALAAALAFTGLAQAAPIAGQGTWEATLQPRYFTNDHSKGPQAYFDTDLGITWLANTQYPYNGPNFSGMRWDTAMKKASDLNLAGVTGWRLPSAASDEFAHLFGVTLGNDAAKVLAGEAPNTGPFANVQLSRYWMQEATPVVDGFQQAWAFSFKYGQQLELTYHDSYAWFVHSGDVFAAAVPEPSATAMALAALALSGSIGALRRRKNSTPQ